MKISMGSDHAGYPLKEHLKEYLIAKGHEVVDYGTHSTESCDYPDFGTAAATALARGEVDRAILVCSTGIGISMAANKVKGVRCALCSEPYSAEMTRRHNNANCLAMGGNLIGFGMGEKITDVFLETEFEGGRHQRRVDKVMAVESL